VESLIGTTLGGYTLMRAIGSGGMGTVYLAEDQSVGQQVAIKIVRTEDDDFADLFSKEQAIERFKQEARAIATLDHLHILPLYRYGEEKMFDGVRAYMVMQYRPEGSLWDWLRKRAGQTASELSLANSINASSMTSLPTGLPTNWPLSVTEAADYLQQASSALQYAHEHGIVHRDVKPANFLLRFDKNHATNTTNAFLLLSDFGLAKFFSTGSATSHVLGTPIYMAPEQFYSSAGPESDQYALAVMVYYMLAGRPPFSGDPVRLMHQHLNETPPPIRMLVPTIAPGIEAVLNRALAKQPHDRYPSIEAFAEDFLQRMQNTAQVHNTQFAPSRPITPASYATTTPAPPVPSFPNTPASLPPTIIPPQSALPYTGTQPPTPAVFERTATSSANQPPMSFASSPNPAQLAQPAYPAGQSWNQEATIQQVTQPSGPASSTTGTNKVSRRGALGWIIGGVAVVGLGVGAGIYIYENQQSANASQPGKNPSNFQQGQQTPGNFVTASYVLSGHSDEVSCLSWSPTTTYLASGSLDNTVRIWNIKTQQTVLTYMGHTQGVEAVSWSRSEQASLIASGGKDESVRTWDSQGNDKASYPNQGAEVSSLAWTPGNGFIFVGTRGAGLHEIAVIKAHVTQLGTNTVIETLALSLNGHYLAIGLRSGIVTILSLPGGKLFHTYSRRANSVYGLAWSSDNTLLAIGGSDKIVEVMDITTRSIANSLVTTSGANSLSWEPGNTGRLAIAQTDNTMVVWNTNNNTTMLGTGHTGAVTAVEWNSRYLASASADKTIRLWKV
jgi:eukaryotic-like serine/threonine-protein kinase